MNRPASFCGVVALKPEYGKLSKAGVIPVAPSLDTVGFITRSVDDAHAVYCEVVEAIQPTNENGLDVRRLAGFFKEEVEPSIGAKLEPLLSQFPETALPINVQTILDQHLKVAMVELEEVHREWFAKHKSEYRSGLAELIQQGAQVEKAGYLDEITRTRKDLDTWLEPKTVLVCPATATLPPCIEKQSTGDPLFNSRK